MTSAAYFAPYVVFSYKSFVI